MTAGTDPDLGESSNAVKMPSIMQNRHIPYQDHNYGQLPPMTPPDSSSPAPDDIDTGNEEDEGNAITRCICGFDHDDGYMICCDKCSVWQHIECMGISSDSVPENYLCEQCDPRPLDRDRAKDIQSRKREEMSDDDDDDDDDESAEEPDGTTYTAVSTTPTRITLTAKVNHQKRKSTGPKIKGEKDKDKKTKRRKRQKQRLSTGFLSVDEEANGPWENNCSTKAEYYEEAKECTYSKELEEYIIKLMQNAQVMCMPNNVDQFCKVVEVQRNTKGLVATEDLSKNHFLVKFKGKMMLGSEFEDENPIFKRYYPYVLFYNIQDSVRLCVDARVYGNDARFIRRSCSPNAEVRHVVQNGKLFVAVFTVYHLPKGSEITIPFEFSFTDYNCLVCACSQDTCAVAKYKAPSQELNSIMEQNGHKMCDDSSNSSHNPLSTSPLGPTLSNQNSFQGDSDSDLDNNHDRSSEAENRRKKLSREERKLEAYVKQFEKMEKKAKKRQPQKEHRVPVLRMASDEGKPHFRGIRCPKRLNHKRRSVGTPSGLKNKRARVSSCSSEPLSPDEVSSSASTPSTPKTVTTIPEEPLIETPSTSPSRNFGFSKTKVEEISQDTFYKIEAVSSSAMSSPGSPCSPRESEPETKQTLSTASSNSDIAMEIEMEDSEVVRRLDEACEVSLDRAAISRDLGSALSVRLAEITSVTSSESNTPSPCPSTSASPTSSESVMNTCPPSSLVSNGGRSPGPALGSPFAALLHGVRTYRDNPLYCSLKKRWLCKYLCSHNGVSLSNPANGLRASLGILSTSYSPPSNHKNVYSTINREPLPLKKRHLKNLYSACRASAAAINSCSTMTVIPVKHQNTMCTITSTDRVVSTDSGILIQQNEQPTPSMNNTPKALPANLHDSSDEDFQPSRGELAGDVKTNPIVQFTSPADCKSMLLSDIRTLETRPSEIRTLNTTQTEMIASHSKHAEALGSSHGDDSFLPAFVGKGTLEKVPEVKPVMISAAPLRRPSDPRLLSPSATQLGTTYSMTSPVSVSPVQVSPAQQHVATTSIAPSVSDPSSGTPGKKKVSLLEYRNRSLQRLSGDGTKPTACASSSQVSNVSCTLSSSSPLTSSVLKATSVSTARSTTKKAERPEANGPCIEPVSPGDDARVMTGRHSRLTPKITNLPASNSPRYEAKLNSLVKKEEGVNRFNKNLSALISEQLMSDPRISPSSSKSPSTASNSPSVPPPPPPPLEPAGKGDAMEIEEEDGQSDQKIFVTTPIPPASRPPLQVPPMQVPPRSPVIPEYSHQRQIQEYRMAIHDHHNHAQTSLLAPMMQQGTSQLPSPISAQSHLQARISSSPYLVTAAPPMPSQIRFPASYQNPSVQGATYYQQ